MRLYLAYFNLVACDLVPFDSNFETECKLFTQHLVLGSDCCISQNVEGRSLDSYMSSYDDFLVIGDLNSEISGIAMSEFCKTYNLQNLVKDPTCYKNPSKPTCIDLILTDFPKSFQHTQMIKIGLSDFQKLT